MLVPISLIQVSLTFRLIMQDLNIDIVFTDYCMPEMSGYDLLKAVKEHGCPKSLPVVIMSSENEP